MRSARRRTGRCYPCLDAQADRLSFCWSPDRGPEPPPFEPASASKPARQYAAEAVPTSPGTASLRFRRQRAGLARHRNQMRSHADPALTRQALAARPVRSVSERRSPGAMNVESTICPRTSAIVDLIPS